MNPNETVGVISLSFVCAILYSAIIVDRIYSPGIVVTSLDSDSERPSPLVSSQPLVDNDISMDASNPNDELVTKVILNTLKSPDDAPTGSGLGALFDHRRWGDLTPLERMAAGMFDSSGPLTDPIVTEVEDVTMDMD